MDYEEFLQTKRHTITDSGFDPILIPDKLFDFQKEIVTRACKRGRMALFLDTGLGKTFIQISIADNVVIKTNKRVLIITPLAVAFQFISEAEKLGIDDIEYSKEGKFSKKIVVCNYERLHYFNPSDFVCVMLDESSILKNFKGSIKSQITSFMKKIDFRYLSTATPSPNDFIELGTSAESLGYMGYMDMLGKFFANNNNTSDSSSKNIGVKYYLKPHAEKDFFAWVNQWSVMVRRPSDIGFSDERYILPELVINQTTVKNQSMIDVNGQIQLFTPIATRQSEVIHEQKQTITERCEKATELASGKTSVYWCNFNDESEMLNEIDKEAIEIRGSMSIEKKEDILVNFANGNIKRIITKAKMTGMGLNWQHCNHSVFFPTWSYEQYYQAIRRFWRFGQKRPVTIDLVISDGQKRVLDSLTEKMKKADSLYTELTRNVNSVYEEHNREFNKKIVKPNFI